VTGPSSLEVDADGEAVVGKLPIVFITGKGALSLFQSYVSRLARV